MGMYDCYEPLPLRCPICDRPLEDWQGKDGPCAIFVWREGVAAPIAQLVDEDCALSPEDRGTWRLPEEFTIYTGCPGHDDGFLFARCRCENGIWVKTELLPVDQRRIRRRKMRD